MKLPGTADVPGEAETEQSNGTVSCRGAMPLRWVRIAAVTVGAVVLLGIWGAVGAILAPPRWVYVVLACVIALVVCKRYRTVPMRRAWAGVAAVLVGWFALVEYVPRGHVTRDTVLNGVRFGDLSGAYYEGTPLGNRRLRMTPAGRFYFRWTTDIGVFDTSKGNVHATGDYLVLRPKFANVHWGQPSTPTELLPVRWGERIYLVAKDQVAEFCSDVNMGLEPVRSPPCRHYVCYSDWDRAVRGWPLLPARWRRYLIDRPARGRVVRLLDVRTGVINAGSGQGLREGMVLYAADYHGVQFSRVRVRSVSATEATVECVRQDNRLVLGQAVSTVYSDPGLQKETAKRGKSGRDH